MENVPCDICGNIETIKLYELSDYLMERPKSKSILVCCTSCGLVYQNPRPNEQEMRKHYPSEYELYHTSNIKSRSIKKFLLEVAYRYGMYKRFRFVNIHKSSGRLLDIGCATGAFLNSVRQFSLKSTWELVGVEIDPTAANIARSEFGLDIFTGALEQAKFDNSEFDAVTLWDVLEHLHKPSSQLLEINRILKPDGILVLRVPNLACWEARFFGKYWSGYEPPRHLYAFSSRTLRLILDKTGFCVIRTSTSISNYLMFVLSIRFWLVGIGVSASKRRIILNALYHPLMRLITVPIFFLVNLLSSGPALVMVAKKKKIIEDEITH
jgi:2-polyprenyl-3-methyl-5-hydroxy-6-metoxy-1,4-benzoquinol methylase